jgi:hypothetical protein
MSKAGELMRKFSDYVDPPLISVVALERSDGLLRLDEGKWIDGRYYRNIRIDRDTHFSDADDNARHAHVYGRHDRNAALVVIRQDGGSSHGKPGTLHKLDADALRAQGITVRDDNIVEWFEIERGDGLEMLLEALGH